MQTLDTALAIIKEEGNDKILLMAHSTGGLITPYYLDSKKGKLPVDGLILNSPFLDWNFGWMMEKIVIPVVSCIGKLFPNLTVQGYGDASYAHSLLKQFKGEWVYNTDWKMINGPSEKSRMDKRHTRSAENSAERDRPGLSGTGDVVKQVVPGNKRME